MFSWLNSWWTKVPTPRILNLIVGSGYLSFTLGGYVTLANPPQTIVSAGGDVVMILVGLFLLFGGLISIFAGTREFWQLERVGLVATGFGLLMYAYIVASLHFTETGSRLTQLSVIAVAFTFILLRLAMIWRYDYKPRG